MGTLPHVAEAKWRISRDVGSLIQHVFFFHLFILVRG